MSDLSRIEKRKLEKFFGMDSGYVLEFSNRTFSEFIYESLRIEIYDDKYEYGSGSKANRLRAFWDVESNYNVGKLTKELLTNWHEEKVLNLFEISKSEQNLFDECVKIYERLLQATIVEEIEVINDNTNDKDFNLLAKQIKESIKQNEPEAALDRLHTYAMKYIRKLCKKHEIGLSKEESLNALYGKYIKFIISNQKIESVMAEKILKYSINVLDAFNDIRNNKSFAHDNPILNYSESVLIFNNVTNSIKFIESIEEKIDLEKKQTESTEQTDWSDIPF
ncbi:abortive infection family protein [Flammeovirga sp. MY04]|uniref:abortive infection family protein n=1 Tax=Flammeovirga sp. MY04 TaxID=1191459 RepID=UPI0008063C91|nr:abortive infection family protein [Flammeovirga sp. MY04]ANQ49388.1 abortive infection family protein [Flammeovirga sp. MY04]